MVDVINLCRNISDGVRPFMPPCSLVSLYAFTKISYLSLPSFMFGISSIARKVSIKSKERDIIVTVDGEPIGILPGTFQVHPNALTLKF
jgi:hypothetical protein